MFVDAEHASTAYFILHVLIGVLLISQTVALNNVAPIKIFYDSSNHLHRDMQYHPEQSARIDTCVKSLSSFADHSSTPPNCIELVDVAPLDLDPSPVLGGLSSKWDRIQFSDDALSHARNMLIEIHSEELVSSLEIKCRSSRDRRIQEGKDALGFVGYLDDDTYLTTESYDVCLRATACWIDCVNEVLGKKKRSGSYAMALTRPPGHHATRTLPNGFCTFNFATAAAAHAIQRTGTFIMVKGWLTS